MHWRNLEPSTTNYFGKISQEWEAEKYLKKGGDCGGKGEGEGNYGDLFSLFFFISCYFLSRYWAKCPWAEEPHKSPSPLIWSQHGQTTTHGRKTCGNTHRNSKIWQVSTDRNWRHAIVCSHLEAKGRHKTLWSLSPKPIVTLNELVPLNSRINQVLWHSDS